MIERDLYDPVIRDYEQTHEIFYEVRIVHRIVDVLLVERKTSMKEIIALEFKMRDWEKAVWQALSYRLVAHRVYVVMYEKGAHFVDEHVLRELGIGFMIASPTNYEIKIEPKRVMYLEKKYLARVFKDRDDILQCIDFSK